MIAQPPIAIAGRSITPAIEELAAVNRWVCWKPERRNGKITKPPYCIGGKRKASSTDPTTWDTFDLCWASAFVDAKATGIGFVLGNGIIGIDLDDCIIDGVVQEWALAVVRRANSYTEISPSGNGLHIIGKGEMTGDGRKVGGIEVIFTVGTSR